MYQCPHAYSIDTLIMSFELKRRLVDLSSSVDDVYQ